MINRSRQHIALPASLSSADCSASLDHIIDEISSGVKNRIKAGKKAMSSQFYRGVVTNPDGTITQDVVDALCAVYENKCAFCESKRFAPDVEHFRPKKNVTGVPHQIGYYWLCYEWTNLLPSCADCNDFKLTSFPILDEANRVFGPIYTLTGALDTDACKYINNPLIDEVPLLLHPEFDPDVGSKFVFYPDGNIKGIDAEGRAEMTREICGLNRKDLVFYRLKVIQEYRDYIELSFLANSKENYEAIIERLRARALNTEEEYTLLCRYVYSNFVDIIVPILPIPIQYDAEQWFLAIYRPL